MKILAMFSVSLALLFVGFVTIMLAIAGFCYIVKKIHKKRKVNARLLKWAYTLDWLEEEDDDSK